MTPEPAAISCGRSGALKNRRKNGSRSSGLSSSAERDLIEILTTAGVTWLISGASVGMAWREISGNGCAAARASREDSASVAPSASEKRRLVTACGLDMADLLGRGIILNERGDVSNRRDE